MKYLIIGLVLAAAGTAQAQGVSCQQIGSTMLCSNGLSSNTIGNTEFFSDGTVRNRVGNTDFYSSPPQIPYSPTFPGR